MRSARISRSTVWFLLMLIVSGRSAVWVGQANAADEAAATKLETTLNLLERALRKVPRESISTDAILEKVGRDPGKIAEWVKNNTAWVPYSGVLRGPRGVLLDRVGSDLDRNLLLAQLVCQSGFDVRLARTELLESEAKQRLQLQAKFKLPVVESSDPSEIFAKMLATSDRESDQLCKLIKTALRAEDFSPEQVNAARDHWWLQVNLGRGLVDMDLALSADTGKATHLGTGKVTNFACSFPDLTAKLPADIFHVVELQVTIERWESGKLKEDTAITWGFKTWDDPEIHVYLQHSFENAAEIGKLFSAAGADAPEAGKASRVLLKTKKWQPSLMVNGRFRGPKVFDDAGVVSDAPNDGAASVGKSVRAGFGGLTGVSSGADTKKPQAVLTAEWLDISIKSPGYPVQVVRREIFDSLGPAKRAIARNAEIEMPVIDESAGIRRALAMAGRSDNLIATARYPFEYMVLRKCMPFLENRSALIQTFREGSGKGRWQAIRSCLDPNLIAQLNYSRSFGSNHLVCYIDRPNIMRQLILPTQQPNGKFGWEFISDFAFNSSAGWPGTGENRLLASVHRGVADTACEAIAVGRIGKVTQQPDIRSTVVLFSGLKDSDLVLVQKSTDDVLTKLQIPEDVRQRIADDVARGYLVVLPKVAVQGRMGWWRTDPKTGVTIGVMDNGYCNDSAEVAGTHIPENEVAQTLVPQGASEAKLAAHGQEVLRLRALKPPANLGEALDIFEKAWETVFGENIMAGHW
jgi:hypothetical protein